jgi:dienelactone hydrolase
MAASDLLQGWDSEEFTAAGITHQVWKTGSGPGVVLIHEIPGITPTVARLANEVVAAGFRVVLPLLVGSVGPAPTTAYLARSFTKVCVSREFTTWATGRTSPVVDWLRALGRNLHQETGGSGIGAIGMCFSGGFVLGMMVDDHLRAAVASQPSLPLAFGAQRSADLGISTADAEVIAERAGVDCEVLALRYTGDRLVGDRFSSLRNLLGDSLLTVELPSGSSRDHSVLTEHRNDSAVAEVIEFLCSRLQKSD